MAGPRIGAFRAASSSIELHIVTQENDDTATTPPHDGQVQPLLTASISPVAAPGYPDHHLENAQDILGLNLIHVLGHDDDWQRWFVRHRRGERPVPRGLAADSSLFAIDAALRGDGVLLGRRLAINAHPDSGRLVQVFSPPHALQADYCLRHHAGAANARDRDRVSRWQRALAGAG